MTRQAGTEDEIEVTQEMIEAGAEVIFEWVSSEGLEVTRDELAALILRAALAVPHQI